MKGGRSVYSLRDLIRSFKILVQIQSNQLNFCVPLVRINSSNSVSLIQLPTKPTYQLWFYIYQYE